MCEAIIDLFRDEWDEGMKKAKEEGIKGLVETCKTLGASQQFTLKILIEKMSLQQKQAEEYLLMYW